MDTLKLMRLNGRRMQDFERLMSGKEFGGCYCAVWSNGGEGWNERCRDRPHENLEHTARRVRGGNHAGFLISRESDGAIIGWTGSGPKTGFPFLKERPGSRLGPWDDSVWAIGCLAIAFAHRGRGYAPLIVDLLVDEARRAGAASIEAYPIEPEEEGSAYRGGRKLYEAAGFSLADGEPSGEHHMLRMVRALGGAPAAAPASAPEEFSTS